MENTLIKTMKMAEEDDVPKLSTETMACLQEFLCERYEKDLKIREIIENKVSEDVTTLTFGEDWQLSQFWYTEETALTLARVAVQVAGPTGRICLISCPTLYRYVKRLGPKCKVSLLEFDQRFAVYKEDFLLYDYKSPLDLPRELASQFDVVVMDPPFLSEECLTKTAVTAKFLAKDNIILCTGAVMEDLVRRLLKMERCQFEPRHQNNLANEFYCYSNFDFDNILASV